MSEYINQGKVGVFFMGIDVKEGEEVVVPWAMLGSLDWQKFGVKR